MEIVDRLAGFAESTFEDALRRAGRNRRFKNEDCAGLRHRGNLGGSVLDVMEVGFALVRRSRQTENVRLCNWNAVYDVKASAFERLDDGLANGLLRRVDLTAL